MFGIVKTGGRAEALADIIPYYRGADCSKATLGGGKKDNYAKRLYKSERHGPE
jgi:hypothetical protein